MSQSISLHEVATRIQESRISSDFYQEAASFMLCGDFLFNKHQKVSPAPRWDGTLRKAEKEGVPYLEGYKDFGDCEGIKYSVFKRADVQMIEKKHNVDFLDWFGWSRWEATNPGDCYTKESSVFIQGSRVLITQMHGYDC